MRLASYLVVMMSNTNIPCRHMVAVINAVVFVVVLVAVVVYIKVINLS